MDAKQAIRAMLKESKTKLSDLSVALNYKSGSRIGMNAIISRGNKMRMSVFFSIVNALDGIVFVKQTGEMFTEDMYKTLAQINVANTIDLFKMAGASIVVKTRNKTIIEITNE